MIGRSMLAYIPVNLANLIVSFGTIVVLTRLLDGAEFGRYGIAVLCLQFFHMGVFTWLEAAIARFQARAEEDGQEASHLKSIYAYTARIALPCLFVGLAVLWLSPLSVVYKTVISAAITSTCFQVFLNLGLEAHKASHRIGRYSAVHTTQMLLSFTLGIALAFQFRELGPFFGIMIANVVVLLIDLPFMWKRFQAGQVETPRIKNYFAYGLPISLSLLLSYTLNSADMFLIARFLGDADAGAYIAGYNLANRSLDILFVWIAMAVTPIAVTALERDGLESSRDVLKDYGAALLWLAMPAATGIALVAEPAGFIVGEEIRDRSVSIIPLIALSGLLNGVITYYAHRAFMLSKKTDMFMWIMVPPVVLNIALNLWLIPQYQLIGAAYATVIAYALGLVLAFVVGRKLYPLPLPVRAFLEIGLACAVMAGVVMAVPIPSDWPDVVILLVKAAIGAIVYSLVSFGLNTANCRTVMGGIVTKLKSRRVNVPVETLS